MSEPLTGLRVVDCSTTSAGARATWMLSDYGADVTGIEPPAGDPTRARTPAASSVFMRGKRTIVLDPTDPTSRAELLGLVDDADVFVESWPPGVARDHGLDFTALHERAPGLVACSISGFGVDGPHRGVPGHEALVHAIVGTMSAQVGHRDGPIFQALPFASMGAAYLAVIGILGALHRRGEDGRGRHVETSLLDGALAYHSMLWGESDESAAAMEAFLAAGTQPTSGMRIITRTYACADGEYLGVHTGAVGGFGRLMEVLGLADRIPPSESGLDMGMPLTPDQQTIVAHEIPAIFASKPRQYWVDTLLAADVCAIEHLHPGEVFDQAQAIHNEMVVDVDDPVLGRVQQVAPPAKFPAPPTEPASIHRGIRGVLTPVGGAGVDTRPLFDGIRVLDLGAYYAGPYSSRLLADLGADVIKVEPTRGDPLRGIERPFYSAQAGKRSLAADLKDPELRPAIERLLVWADVVHHNLRPGAAERLGLDWQTVHEINPRVVYLYAPGWGSSGPHAQRQSFAPMMSGFAGVTYEVAGQFNEPMPPVGNEDPGNGLLGAAAILMALLERQRTGMGQYVENPQLNATMAHMAHVVRSASTHDVIGANRLDPAQLGFDATERLYETADGWLCVVAVEDHELAALARVIGAELATATDDVRADCISAAFAARKTDELLADLRAAGVPAAEPVGRNSHAFMNDPENRRTGRVAEVAHPTLGNVRELAVLLRVSDTEVPVHRLAPDLGEHTDEILREVGYTDAQVEGLRARGRDPVTGLLDGVRVVETGVLLTVDFLGMLLGDEGADVVKVESPQVGDYIRNILTRFAPDWSTFHLSVNRNKRSVTIDARGSEGQAVLARLLETADVFITGNVGSTNDKLGLDYETVRQIKPDIVYCQATGFGAAGPYAEIPTHGQMMDALGGGAPSLEVGDDGFTHVKQGTEVPGSSGGVVIGPLYAAFGVAAGLSRRDRTGEGCYLDVSCADAVIAGTWLRAVPLLNPEKVDADFVGGGVQDSAKYQYYETSDGKFVLFCGIEAKFWDHFCRAVGREDLLALHERDRVVDFANDGDDLRRELTTIFRAKTQAEWVAIAIAADVAMGPALRFDEISDDLHVKARGMVVTDEHPVVGPFLTYGNPLLVRGERFSIRPAPSLGEHTDEVLAALGYSGAERAALRDRGVV